MNKRMRVVYPREFKLRAVERAKRGDRSIRQLESEMGLSDNLLRHWVQDFDKYGEKAWIRSAAPDEVTTDSPAADAAGKAGMHASPDPVMAETECMRRQLLVLQQQNEALQQDNAILKKALKIFSLESK